MWMKRKTVNNWLLMPVVAVITVTIGMAAGNSDCSLAGQWILDATGTVKGATENTPCCPDDGAQPGRCGVELNALFHMGDPDITVTQTGSTLSASEGDPNGNPFYLEGTVKGKSVTFTITGDGINPCLPGSHATTYVGHVIGNKIEGTFSGFGSWDSEQYTWSGEFIVTIINACDDVVCEDAPCVKCDPATGECTAPGVGQPHMMCDDGCVNTQNDDFNCGDCGIECDIDAGEKCVNGVCKAPKPKK